MLFKIKSKNKNKKEGMFILGNIKKNQKAWRLEGIRHRNGREAFGDILGGKGVGSGGRKDGMSKRQEGHEKRGLLTRALEPQEPL